MGKKANSGLARLWVAAPLLYFAGALSEINADTVLITGANSGLGLEFTKQYAAKGWTVIATHRRSDVPESLASVIAEHPNVRVERMDVASIEEVEALAAKLDGVAIDVLINNAGVYSDRASCVEETCVGTVDTQTFGNMDYGLLDTIITVNVRGPLVVSERFIDHVRASEQKKIVSVSSTNGSLTLPFANSNALSYRASKAALNRAMQIVAVHLQKDGVTVLLLNPGSVLTERIGASVRRSNAVVPGMIEMAESVAGMIEQIDQATLDDTGRFFNYDGTEAPW